jgi:hypothetical protein
VGNRLQRAPANFAMQRECLELELSSGSRGAAAIRRLERIGISAMKEFGRRSGRELRSRMFRKAMTATLPNAARIASSYCNRQPSVVRVMHQE